MDFSSVSTEVLTRKKGFDKADTCPAVVVGELSFAIFGVIKMVFLKKAKRCEWGTLGA